MNNVKILKETEVRDGSIQLAEKPHPIYEKEYVTWFVNKEGHRYYGHYTVHRTVANEDFNKRVERGY